MAGTTVYLVWDDSEDSMGCSCCKTTSDERLVAIYFNEEDARNELKSLAKQDEEAGHTIEWDTDGLWYEASEEDHVVHKYFVQAGEVR
jgi:hypothetical protein